MKTSTRPISSSLPCAGVAGLALLVLLVPARAFATAAFPGDTWHLDGSAADSNGTNPGTPHNVSFASGAVGQAALFDGSASDQVIQLSTLGSPALAQLGVEACVNPTILKNGDSSRGVTIFQDGFDGNIGFAIRFDATGHVQFDAFMSTGLHLFSFTQAAPLALNRWSHVAVSYDGAQIKLYVDGQLADTVALDGIVNASTICGGIGGETTSGSGGCVPERGYSFVGRLDEVKFAGAALDLVEIAASSAACVGANQPVNQPPVAQCRDLVLNADATCGASGSVDNGSFDPDAADSLTLVQSAAGPYGLGATSVTLTATDNHGATSSCTATVTVRDTTPPKIDCGPAQTIECESPDGTAASVGAGARDGCSATRILGAPPATFPLGTTQVPFTAWDAAGNSSSCNATVVVVDRVAPSITCNPATTVECSSHTTTSYSGLSAIATDACSGSVAVNSLDASGSIVGLGEKTVSFSAADGTGNTSSCTQNVSVVDHTPPMLTCLKDITVKCAPATGAAVDLSSVAAADVCDPAPTVTFANARPTYPVGITQVAYSARDASNNESSQCTTNIIVDQAPPTEIDDKLFVLWPPNHKYVTVGLDKCIAKIVDTCNAGLTLDQVVAGARIVAYGSDEPQSVIGSGNTNGDLLATLGKPGPVQVRAERSGMLDGRVYSVWFDWTNAEGITTKGTLCQLGVPHDQGGKTTPIDSGVKKGWCVGPAPYCP